MRLNFDGLLIKALKEWPHKFDLSVLQYANPDLSRYTAKGLSDAIEDRYIGTETEVITRTLHGAIYSVVHTAAKTVVQVELSSLRSEAGRLVFEQYLKKSAVSTTLNWRSEDYKLAEDYFAQNSSQGNSLDSSS